AVLVIDKGKPRTLRVGETGPNGVTLISVTSEQAIIEVEGKRRRLTLGEAISTAAPTVNRPTVTLISDRDGHFVTTGSINGATVRLLVDTGASLVAMGLADARRAGVNYLAGEKAYANTANGIVPIYRVRLSNVRVGEIVLNDVEGMVHANADMPLVLLGMSFLGKLDMRREGDSLTLIRRY
ncbi:MAG: retropepsin-like aspartic protease family protein, partial [Burkholderiales bacterium]